MKFYFYFFVISLAYPQSFAAKAPLESSGNIFSVSFLASTFIYLEPGFMDQVGGVYGAGLDWVRTRETWSHRYSLSLVGGMRTYHGFYTFSGAPLENPVYDNILNMGFRIEKQSSKSIKYYLGISDREWRQTIRESAGFRRQVTLIYVPLGMSKSTPFGDFQLEWKPLLFGLGTTLYGDYDSGWPTVRFRLPKGNGFQFSYLLDGKLVSLDKTYWRLNYEVWRINDSRESQFTVNDNGSLVGYSAFEPGNFSEQVMIEWGYRFDP